MHQLTQHTIRLLDNLSFVFFFPLFLVEALKHSSLLGFAKCRLIAIRDREKFSHSEGALWMSREHLSVWKQTLSRLNR
ncbi:hypothetical protein F5Y09DRAFT_295157 [Xylaria sp. FL1042]|nr:hypothetical protein F5Y09DRAFT_295157 [Xylaria sp. FL1042]